MTQQFNINIGVMYLSVGVVFVSLLYTTPSYPPQKKPKQTLHGKKIINVSM